MLDYLDYIYYRTYHYYERRNDSRYDLMARGVLGVTLMFNLLFVLGVLTTLFNIDLSGRISWLKWVFGVSVLLLIELLKLRYKKNVPIEALNERWSKETVNLKRKRELYILTYVLGSFALIIIWAAIFNKN